MILTTCAVAVVAGVPDGLSAQQYAAAPSAAVTTAQQRSALIGQLSDPAVANAEQQLGAVQKQLVAAQQSLAATNVRLVAVQGEIAENQQSLTKDQADLAAAVRATYVDSGQTGLAVALLSSDNFNEAVDRYQGAQHISDQVTALVIRVASAKHDLIAEQASLQKNVAASVALEGQLSAQSNRLTAMVAARNSALMHANSQTRSVVAKLDVFDNNSAGSGLPGSVNAQGPCGNHFAYGQCTWYVASRRCVPWMGNAYDWWANARAAGYAEGHLPQAGAVVVWYPGGGGAGGVGHVAYVEAVGPAGGVAAGSFKLSEMNWGGWDQIDYRTLPNNAAGIAGFIYGKA